LAFFRVRYLQFGALGLRIKPGGAATLPDALQNGKVLTVD
jgi:hypothetical protein